MKTRFSWLIPLAVIVLIVGMILMKGKNPQGERDAYSTNVTPGVERLAPPFNLERIGGGKARIADYRGKVVILNFWATWCPPCKAEIPDFIELQKDFGGQGLQIVGIALDKKNKVEDYIREAGVNYHILIGDDQVASAYGGIEAIPTTFIIDRSGKIVQTFVGMRQRNIFEEEIRKLL